MLKQLLCLMFMLCIFLCSASIVCAGVGEEVSVTLTVREGQDIEEVYELAKLKLCQKGMLQFLRRRDKAVMRRNWNILNAERLVFEDPQQYFSAINILEKYQTKGRLQVKAEVVVDQGALADLINTEAEEVIDQLNAVGLSLLFLARAADREVDYREDTVTAGGEGAAGGEGSNSRKKVIRQTAFTTRAVDTTEILTNITSRLTDSGIQLYSVQAFIPYLENGEELEGYLGELKSAYAGYVDSSGNYRAGNTEKLTAYIQREIIKSGQHPQYFALGKIDIGNTVYNEMTKKYRGVAKCSITLWDLKAGLFPVKIATTPVITAAAVAVDKKEAQKNAAEQAATETGNQILDRIRSSMLEEFYKDSKVAEGEFVLDDLLGRVIVDVNEDRLSGGRYSKELEAALELYNKYEYNQAFIIFSRLADDGDIKAQNMLGRMYYDGHGTEQDYQKAAGLFLKGVRVEDAEAEYNLARLYYDGNGVEQDYRKGVDLLERAAAQGYLDAINDLGNIYLTGRGVEQDYLEALKWFKIGMEENFPLSIHNIGYMHLNGLGVAQDISEGIRLLKISAGLGCADSDYNLGELYDDGTGVEQNYNIAIRHYLRAAENNNIAALVRLGSMYLDGVGVVQDYSRGFEYFRRAAKAENPEALFAMGYIYEQGTGVTQDYLEAIKYYRHAAKFEFSPAFSRLGNFFKHGLGVEQDYEKAVDLYRQGVTAGNDQSRIDLGLMYYEGLGVPRDFKKAEELMREAAANGFGAAEYNLGVIYEEGLGGLEDLREAEKWYLKAVQHESIEAAYKLGIIWIEGDDKVQEGVALLAAAADAGYSVAFTALGFVHLDGIIVEQDIAQAIQLYEKGGELGDPEAYFELGMVFSDDIHMHADYYRAFDYYSKAANMGHARAMFLIGAMYHEGRGVKLDFEKALKWYAKSGENGYVAAQMMLANIFENGLLNLEVDYRMAKYWYLKAAEHGSDRAAQKVEQFPVLDY